MKDWKGIIAVCVLALGLGACTATENLKAALSDEDRIGSLVQFTIADLDAAQKSAVAHNDIGAAVCWTAVREYVLELQAQGTTDVVGFATRWQQARNIRRGVQEGLPETVHVACAHMVDDVGKTFRWLVGVAL